MRCKLVSSILSLLLLGACDDSDPVPSDPPETSTIQQLDELSVAQRRVFLKGFSGDWRADTDSSRGLPKPPDTLPIPPGARIIDLPRAVDLAPGGMPVGEVIAHRRSRREFTPDPLTLGQLSHLLTSTQGITSTERDRSGNVTLQLRAAPSGGARYPLETFLAIHRIEGLAPGLYRYLPTRHQLLVVREDPVIGSALQRACYNNPTAGNAAVVFVWAAVPARTEWKYGCIADKMIAIEAGHVCQNLYLASESIGAGTCAMLGYHQPAVDAIIGVDGAEVFTVYLAAVGDPEEESP